VAGAVDKQLYAILNTKQGNPRSDFVGYLAGFFVMLSYPPYQTRFESYGDFIFFFYIM